MLGIKHSLVGIKRKHSEGACLLSTPAQAQLTAATAGGVEEVTAVPVTRKPTPEPAAPRCTAPASTSVPILSPASTPKEVSCERIFTEADFVGVNWQDSNLSYTEFLAFKRSMLNTPVPKQTVSNKELHAAGFASWAQHWIELSLLNWG
uniref:Uncharacterized protein n=1 Tax=Chlamydomonas leiostraca TaxID=1034604 RepID=A0A7S0RHJ7_9CHLO|mmetsp:Transcript_22783/g.57941  ORF Transcript_22783/g.57941 Transcript_22783/m.57941 type:complete len:149 (+) Transcript_22783:222-668(+)